MVPRGNDGAVADGDFDASTRRLRGSHFWAIAILVLAAGLRLWGLDMGLPHLETRPDETQVVALTVEASQGRFDFDWFVYPHAYVYLHWIWGEVVVQIQQWIGLASSAGYQEIWKREPHRLYWIGRALSALAGLLTVALVMQISRREYGDRAALLAGLLLAVCFLHVRESHAYKPDVLLSLAATLAVAGAVGLARAPSLWSGVRAGLAVGFAAAAKYNGVVAAIPVCVAAWSSSQARGWSRLLPPPPLLAAGLSAILFFAATSPFVLIDESSRATLHQTLHVVFPSLVAEPTYAEKLPDLGQLIGPEAPTWAASKGVWGTFWYHIAFSLRHGVGLAATVLAPVAVVWGFMRGALLGRASAVFCVAWFVVIGFSPVMLSRYLTPMLPALAILEAGLVVWLLHLLPSVARRWLLPGVLLLLLAEPLWSSIQHDRLAAREDTRVAATRWLEARAPAGSRVTILGTRFWNWGAPQIPPQLRLVSFAAEQPIDLARVDFVVTHDHRLFWSHLPPSFLAQHQQQLERVADFNPAVESATEPVFELSDAFYIPYYGFQGVERPGPRVQIYRVR